MTHRPRARAGFVASSWRRSLLVVSLLVGLGGVVATCAAPRRQLAAQCAFNDDCADPLVCAGNVCRAQCRTDRDCPSGTMCAPSDQADKRVCLPPDAPPLCVYDSDCAGNLICARDGVCRVQCHVDADCRSYGQGIIALTCNTATNVCMPAGDGGADQDAAGDGAVGDVVPATDADHDGG